MSGESLRTSFDCTKINEPKTIAGVDWKVVVGIVLFFGMAALMYRAPGVLLVPFVGVWLLRGPGLKDPDFLKVHLRHRNQRDRYSPAYVTKPNFINPRPNGFSRLDQAR